MSAPLLQVGHLSTCLESVSGTVRAVDDLSFNVEAGETFALLGESGCGKSMTALSLLRLLPDAGCITGGSVHFDGLDLLGLTESQMREVRGRDIAMIFQEPATSLNPVLTVGQQISEVLARHRMKAQTSTNASTFERAAQLLDQVGIPDARRRLTEYPFQLSGGMKQRVMIAMALAGEPRLLIADEPTTALDVTIQAQVLQLLGKLQQERQMAMLLITHDLGVVHLLAHRIGVMYAGELVEIATRAEFFNQPLHPYSLKLFAAVPSTARRGTALETISGSVPSLTSHFVGCRFAARCDKVMSRCHNEIPLWHSVTKQGGEVHQVRCHLYESTSYESKNYDNKSNENQETMGSGVEHISRLVSTPALTNAIKTGADVAAGNKQLLDVVGLKVHFPVRKGLLKRVVGYVKAVDGVSLKLAAGKTLAIVGESGCGKTTVGKAILQLIKPTAGAVHFAGHEISNLSPGQLRPLRSAMQIIFQDPYASLNPRMRVGEIIEEGLLALDSAQGRVARERRVMGLMEQVGLSADMRGRYPHEFSGGQRQRIAIARALAVNPQLLICDEPTSALDVSVQAQILNLFKELQDSLGLSYLFITHNIAVVDYLAHEVAVMYLGRIVEHGTVEEILRDPKHPYTEALLSAVPSFENHIDGTLDSPSAKTARPVIILKGDMPSPLNPPNGCHFHPRCPRVMAECKTSYPAEVALSSTRTVHCHLYKAAI